MMKPRMFFALAATACLFAAAAASARAQDAAAGHMVFLTHCGICHGVLPGQNRVGPTLFGVMGRRSGTVPDFTYSPANVASGLTWDAPTLDRYINNPQGVIPGTSMSYAGIQDAGLRANLIAYLATLH